MTTTASALRSMIDPWHTAPLVPVLQRRRASLVDSLDGEVLVLTGPPAVLPDDDRVALDHVVTVGWLGAAAELGGAIAGLVDRLGPEGWLHSIEPTTGPASTARAQRLSAPVSKMRTGWHIGRDLPAALRSCGLVVTDVERFSMPVSSTVLRPWVATRSRVRVTNREAS